METSYETRIVNYALQTCGFYPLRAIQLWIVDSHFTKVKSTMMNIGALLKLDAAIDLERLAAAVNDLLNAYDIFHCRFMFHPGTDDICQRFDGEIAPVTVEKISDEEFEQRKKSLMEPYNIINHALYRIYIFETPTAKYLYVDFYHAIMDGTAASILFWRELEMRYRGKKIQRAPLNYADYILDELKVSPEELAEGNKFWHAMLSGFDESKHLPPPDIEKAQALANGELVYPIKNITQKYFSDGTRKEHIFFLAASMLAIAKSAGSDSAIMDFVHNGRNTAQERRLMGAMLEQYPVRWDFDRSQSVGNFLDGIEQTMNSCLKYRRSIGTVYSAGLNDTSATFVFQKKSLGAINAMKFCGTNAEIIEVPLNEFSVSENTLDVEINLTGDGTYLVEFAYDAVRYSEAAMENFAAAFDEIIRALQDETRAISEILEG